MHERTITVTGTGNVKAKPDLIVVTMSLTAAAPDYNKTMKLANAELEALRESIVSAGHDGQALKTVDFNVRTEQESYKDAAGNWRQKFKGYSCSHELKLEFDFDIKQLGKTLAAISASKANPQFQIAFSVKDKNAVQTELLENAVSNAAAKAKILASAMGIKLGDVQHIDYSWGELRLSSDTRFNDPAVMAAESNSEMQIEPEDVEANDTVTVTWNIV